MPAQDRTALDPAAAITAQLPVTDRRAWTLLAAVALIILAGLLWAMLGRAPEAVTGAGMIVPAEGFVDVGTAVSGSVSEVLVSPGDPVEAGQAVATLTAADGSVQRITAMVEGTVATVVVRQGGTTEPGTPLLTIDPADGGDVAVGFLPAEQAAQIHIGMPALVAVASLPRSQYGYITGTVRSIAFLPVTADRIRLLVGGNEQLPGYFMAAGPVVEVTVALDVDAATPSGYAWTTGTGPDSRITTGELASVSVVVSDRSPLERIAG